MAVRSRTGPVNDKILQTDVAVIGANGYTGGELLRLLADHPDLRVVAATSRSEAEAPLASVFPNLAGVAGLPPRFEDLDADAISDRAGTAFTCLPHGHAQAWVADLRARGLLVVDLSADHRFADRALYEATYVPHDHPDLLDEAVYGLTEWQRAELADADLIANPGCYPTAVLLGTLPLAAAGWIESPVIADCQTGVTGGGRKAKVRFLHAEVSEGTAAYGLPRHRHEAEMQHRTATLAGRETDVIFTPHLAPMNRGILATLQIRLTDDADMEMIRRRYERAYGAEPFVELLAEGALPRTVSVRGTNHVHLQVVRRRPRHLTVLAALDNLGKGAAGQAIQNLNVRLDLAETAGLTQVGLLP